MTVKIAVVTRHQNKRVDHSEIKNVVKKASGLLPENSIMSIAFLSDKEMTGINEVYTGRKGTTDVLSFPLGDYVRGSEWSGEILISLDRASRQAKEKGVLLIHEIIRLLIHGVVHLAGLEHYNGKEFREMRRVEFGLLMKCL